MKISPKVLCNFNDIDGKIKAGFGLFFGIEGPISVHQGPRSVPPGS